MTNMLPKIIYVQFHGRMTRVDSPNLPQNRNFVIQYKEMDWSGFRTLQECKDQFGELEKREGDHFTVVEK